MSKKSLTVLVAIGLLIIFLPGFSRLQKLRSKNKSLNDEIVRLQDENQDLEKQIELLETDPFYIEKKARDKMGIGKEGEIRYKVTYDNE